MTSIESALFLSFYDIANIIASPVIGYFGDKYYKPRIIGASMIGLCIGSLIMVIPEFAVMGNSLGDLYANETGFELLKDQTLCNIIVSNSTAYSTSTIKPSYQSNNNLILNNMKHIFYFANSVNGISSVALYTTVISYIESIFLHEQVHMRQGIYYSIGAIGVGIGMLATGNFLNINGVISKKKAISKNDEIHVKLINVNNPNSVNWIGVILFYI